MESSNSEKIAYINNLLPFMDKNYLINILKSYKEIKDLKIINNMFELPKICVITFDSKKSKQNFVDKSNNKNLDLNINYNFIFEEKKSEDFEEKNIQDFNSIKFPVSYENMINTTYEKTLKEPGLILTDKDIQSRQDKVISYLIKKLGSNLIKGKSVMNISLPVTIFDKRTLHQVFAYEMSFASYYLNKAYYSKDYKIKFNWINAFLISQLYLSPLQFKPFSPIIGETYQCQVGDLEIYLEQTSSKPLVCNFYGVAPNYKIYGHYSTSASTGANSIKATKQGKFFIELKDGNRYELFFPQVFIKGTTVGKRLFNYKKMCSVLDDKNNLASIIKFNPDEKGFFTSFFSSKQKSSPDTFRGEIIFYTDFVNEQFLQYSKKKDAQEVCNIIGEWTNNLSIGGTQYWKINEYPLMPIFQRKNLLPSDSSFRVDLKALIENDETNAQILKEQLEELQRNDRKLRENDKLVKK